MYAIAVLFKTIYSSLFIIVYSFDFIIIDSHCREWLPGTIFKLLTYRKGILIQIAPQFVPMGTIDNMSSMFGADGRQAIT